MASQRKSTRPEIVMQMESRGADGNRLVFPSQNLPQSILLTFNKYDYGNLYRSVIRLNENTNQLESASVSDADVQVKSRATIELPFPNNLTDVTSVRLENYNRSVIAQAGADMLSSANKDAVNASSDSVMGMVRSAAAGGAGNIQSVGKNLISKDSSGREDAVAFVSYILQSVGLNSFGSTISSSIGRTVNPRETLAFNGVDLKTHSFTWQLFPSSKRDTDIIQNIIRTFKENVLPTSRNFGGIEKMFLAYPSTVDMTLLGVDEKYFMDFKTAMITSFSVNYGSGDTVPIIKGGRPAVVTIAVEFTELEARDAGDYTNMSDIQNEDGNFDSGAGE